MSRTTILFAAWCLLLVALSTGAAFAAYSPFSDDERPTASAVRGGVSHK